MSGDLAEISRALGRLEGSIGQVNANCDALFRKYDALNVDVIEQRGAMKLVAAAHAELKTAHDRLTHSVATEVKPTLEEFKTLKNKGIGALFGFGLTGGGLGAAAFEIFKKMLGGETPGPHS